MLAHRMAIDAYLNQKKMIIQIRYAVMTNVQQLTKGNGALNTSDHISPHTFAWEIIHSLGWTMYAKLTVLLGKLCFVWLFLLYFNNYDDVDKVCKRYMSKCTIFVVSLLFFIYIFNLALDYMFKPCHVLQTVQCN